MALLAMATPCKKRKLASPQSSSYSSTPPSVSNAAPGVPLAVLDEPQLDELLPSMMSGWTGPMSGTLLRRGQDAFDYKMKAAGGKRTCKPVWPSVCKPQKFAEWQKGREWLQWSDSLGVFCIVCRGRNSTNFAEGMRYSNLEWGQNGMKWIKRHEGSSDWSTGNSGREHRDALSQILREKTEAQEVQEAQKKAKTEMKQDTCMPVQPVEPVAGVRRDELDAWFRGLYFAGQNRLSMVQTENYQNHMILGQHVMLRTHHSKTSIRDGWQAIHDARRRDVLDAVAASNTWSLMIDGITEPSKMFAAVAVFVAPDGELKCVFLDLFGIEAGVILAWEELDEVEKANQTLLEAENAVADLHAHVEQELAAAIDQD